MKLIRHACKGTPRQIMFSEGEGARGGRDGGALLQGAQESLWTEARVLWIATPWC